MQALARQLWVSRATLYRWVGTRERLLSEVLDDLALDLAGKAEAEAEGEGNARVLDFVRRLMKAATRSEPIRAFVAREPELARRLILSERGPVHKRLVHGLTLVLADTRGPDPAPALVEFADLVVQFGTAVGWATLAIGDSPRIERTVDLARVLLEAPRKTDGAPAGGRVGPGLIGESR